jgi:hypothetical protein
MDFSEEFLQYVWMKYPGNLLQIKLVVSEVGPSEPSLTSSGAKVSLTVGLCPA